MICGRRRRGCPAAEAHATRAEQAYRTTGAGPADLTQASLMAFAAVDCHHEADELALLSWRATRLAGALSALDFSGPIPRAGEVGSGDALLRTVRLVAAALSGMTHAAQATADPQRPPGEAHTTADALDQALVALQQAAADTAHHRGAAERTDLNS